MSPPFRPKEHQEALWRGLQAGICTPRPPTTACSARRRRPPGKDDFAQIPNGCGGVEDRMAVLWHDGVNTGRLTPSEFVAVTSANAAQDLQPLSAQGQRRVGADADLVVWDPRPPRPSRRRRQHQQGRLQHLRGPHRAAACATHTLSQGKLVWANGDLRATRRRPLRQAPAFGTNFEAVKRRSRLTPTAVAR